MSKPGKTKFGARLRKLLEKDWLFDLFDPKKTIKVMLNQDEYFSFPIDLFH